MGSRKSAGLQGIRIQDENVAVYSSKAFFRHGVHEVRTEKGDENAMITVAQLLGEIEQQVQVAKQTRDEAAQREAIYAVRTLCNLMLDDERPAAAPSFPQAVQLSSVHAAPVTSLNEQPLREADANGESLFDF